MQTCSEFLSSLHLRGVRVWTENGTLRFQAHKGVLVPRDLENLSARKFEIIELLEQAQSAVEPPILPRKRGCRIPLTELQLRIWNTKLEHGGRPSARRCVTAVRISGALDLCLLEESISAVIRRHESLRTCFYVTENVPEQHVNASLHYILDVVDLSAMSEASKGSEVARLAQDFVQERVDVAVGPLYGFRLFKLAANDFVLISAFEHMITDGVSKRLVTSEIFTFYGQSMQGSPHALPHLQLQFPDYAVWRQQTCEIWRTRHEEYWRRHLAGAPQIEIPTDDYLVGSNPPSAMLEEILFGDTLSAGLRDTARRERAPLALVVLTIYVAVMSRWCARRDLVLLFVSDGRYRSELEKMTGFIAQLITLRIEIIQEDTFVDLLRRVSTEFYSANNRRDFDRVPLLIPGLDPDLLFDWMPTGWAHLPEMEGKGQLKLHPFPFVARRPGKFIPLFADTPTGIVVQVHYSQNLLARATILRFGDELKAFTERFVRDPLGLVASTPSML